MADQEIIKALECCKKDDCDNCPNDFGNCYANLAGYTLDLITRQRAEIEELQGNLKFVYGTVERQKVEIEQLRKQIEFRREYLCYFPKLERAEAVREFAEKLNDTFANLKFTATTPRRTVSVDELRSQVNWILHTVVPETICNLVKEMEGEKDYGVYRADR